MIILPRLDAAVAMLPRPTPRRRRHASKHRDFRHFPGYSRAPEQVRLLADLRAVIAEAPLYEPAMPRTGKLLSVAHDQLRPARLADRQGRRLSLSGPATRRRGQPWPPMPHDAAWRCGGELADYPALPEACLINYYAARPGSAAIVTRTRRTGRRRCSRSRSATTRCSTSAACSGAIPRPA